MKHREAEEKIHSTWWKEPEGQKENDLEEVVEEVEMVVEVEGEMVVVEVLRKKKPRASFLKSNFID